jgi:signal transduction histidine kinase/CheY-like chemotaxis protein
VKLAVKISITIGGLLLTVAIILTSVSTNLFQKELQSQADSILHAASKSALFSIKNRVNKTISDLKVLQTHNAFASYFTYLAFEDDDGIIEETAHIEFFLSNLYLDKPWYYELTVLPINSDPIDLVKGVRSARRYDRSALTLPSHKDQKTVVVQPREGQLDLIISVPLFSDGSLQGHLIVKQNFMHTIDSFLKVLDSKALSGVVTRLDKTLVKKSENLSKTEYEQLLNFNNTDEWLIVDNELSDLGIRVIVAQKTEQAYAAISKITHTNIMITVACLVLALWILQLLVKKFTLRIAHILKTIQAVLAGNASARINDNVNDELGNISTTLDQIFCLQVEACEQHEATIRRKQTEVSKIKQVLDNAYANFMIVDSEHNITYVNNAIQSMFKNNEEALKKSIPGFEATELISKSLGIFYPDPSNQFNTIARTNDVFIEQYEIAGHTYQTIFSPGFEEDGHRATTVIEWIDLTQRCATYSLSKTDSTSERLITEENERLKQSLKQSEEMLQHLNKELEQQKIKANEKDIALEDSNRYKSEFLANISHELRTPLNSLLVLSKMLCKNKQKNLTGKQIKHASVIYRGGSDLLELVNDILDLSNVESGNLTLNISEVNIPVLCDYTEEKFIILAQEKGINFKTINLLDENIELHSDSHRIDQILKNLITNAMKFTIKGDVTLKVESTEWQNKQAVAMSVIDTGIGIPVEKQQAIFESFQQADGSSTRQHKGTGIGLSIARELSRLLEGKITLQSEEGSGSTFTFTLPLSPKDYTIAPSDKQVQPEPTRKPLLVLPKQTISIKDDRSSVSTASPATLIVEENLDFANTLLNIVRSNGYLGIVTNSGREALKLAETYNFSGVILGLDLPDLSGESVLSYIKQNTTTQHIPVQIITNQIEDRQIKSKGALGVLTQPVDEQQIKAVLQQFSTNRNTSKKTALLVEDNETSQTEIQALLKNKKILLVDDDPNNIYALGTELEDLNMFVTTAEDGQKALDEIAKQTFDLILMDMMMPNMDGYEATRIIRKNSQFNEIPIIALTAKAMTEDKAKCLDAGANDYMSKPIEVSQLLSLMQIWLLK